MAKYAKSQLDRFGRDRLVKILREDFDLMAEDTDTKEDLVRVITEQQAAADYKAQEDAELAQGEPEAKASEIAAEGNWLDDRVRVVFDEQVGSGGQDSIKLALNGVAFNVPRNVEVDLPRAVLRGPVDEARMTLYEQRMDETGKTVTQRREVPRHTYRVIKDPA